jgi:choline dehydrogenase-like flavoprotein
VAGELATAGKRVCVLEMGGYYNESDFDQLELPAYQRLYLNGGPFPTADGQVSIVAGATLGGGTVINWTNCLRTHPWVREEWARDFGLEGVDGADFDRHFDAVLARLDASDACSDLNPVHERLREGCEGLGYDFRPTVRNADRGSYDPASAGYMGFGDQSGSKLSTQKTYLADAQEHGADLIADCRAERIVVEGGRAVGVEARWVDPERAGTNGAGSRVSVRAPVVVVAGGSIESPALLLRSGIGGSAVGDYLRLHPTGAVTGVYGEDQRWWWGPPQSAISHQFADLEDGYGFLVESAQSTTGLFAGATPWISGRDHKERMRAWRRCAPFINLTRDHGHGRVTVDGAGNAVPQYLLADELDIRNFRRGVAELARLHAAAGAEQIISGGRKGPIWERGDDLEAFIDAVTSHSLAPREYAVFTAHQMGSCRMGADPSRSVADPWGQLHDTQGVWIGDASAFPTASGVNPMLTIMALARRTAEAIAAA